MEPMVGWWYGCPSGKSSAPGSFSSQVPYGWLSTDQRRSFLTTSRWLSSFSWVIAGSRLASRSDSSQSASSSSWLGSVSK